jgi:PAS domain S-box-containing protein
MKTPYEIFWELSSDMLSLVDSQGIFVKANPSWSRILGWDLSEMIGRPFMDFVAPDDKARTLGEFERLLSDQVDIPFENRYLHKDGSSRYLEWRTTVVDGIFHCVARDVTFRHQDRVRLEMALSAAGMGVWEWNFIQNEIHWDRHALQIFGSNQPIVKDALMSWKRTVHRDDWERVQKEILTAARGEAPFNTEYRIFAPGPILKTLRSIGQLERDPQGKPERLIGVVWDASHEKAQAETIKRQQIEITNSARLSALGVLTSGIAHEINNPLSVIQGKTALLLKRIKENRLDKVNLPEEIQKIHDTCIRITKIIQGMQALSRDSKGDPFIAITVSEHIDKMIGLCAERIRNHKIQIIIQCDESIRIQGRSEQVGQVILNLLNNAIDATKDCAQREIRIKSHRQSNKIIISVSDSGPGVPAELRDRIMEPFFTTKDVGKGTGLGLSISRGLMEAHKGQLLLAEGLPTTFILEFPSI